MEETMKRKIYQVLILTAVLLPLALWADQTASDNGIDVTVKALPDEIKGFKTFDVTLKSTRKTDHSVEVHILLNDNTVKEPGGARGKCTVMLGLKGGTSMNEKKQCKETSPSNSFSVQIAKVYSKIMN